MKLMSCVVTGSNRVIQRESDLTRVKQLQTRRPHRADQGHAEPSRAKQSEAGPSQRYRA